MKSSRILFFILLVIALLAFISFIFPQGGVALANYRFYFPTWEDMMEKENIESVENKMQELEESLRMKSPQVINSGTDWRQSHDSLSFYNDFFQNHPSRIFLPANNHEYFFSLFKRMENAKESGEVIHILHYGDSQIEGDRITGFLRQRLQERFGGQGPGLIPLVQPIPSMSVGQTASENINRYIIAGAHQNRVSHKRYGVLGQVAQINGGGHASIYTRNWKTTFENVKEFTKVRLFVNNNKENFTVSLGPQEKTAITKTLEAAKDNMSVLTWEFSTPIKKIVMRFSGSAEVTGIALDGDYGITIDNIPLRGSSGTFFTEINSASMTPMMKELNTSLIILQFGGNMMPSLYNDAGIRIYKEKLGKQIAHLNQIYPDAKILLIGPSDMSTKVNGRLQTYPHLKATVNAMREVALENGAAFWDMFQVMGGENSMIKWVNNKPAYASPDHVHFTTAGAERIGRIFFESLMIYYDYYKFVGGNSDTDTRN